MEDGSIHCSFAAGRTTLNGRSSCLWETFSRPPTSGVYALVWRVEDEVMAESFFHKKGLRTTRKGSVSNGFAIDPRDFFNARHEFVQAPGSPLEPHL
jgi:hypothetical protein